MDIRTPYIRTPYIGTPSIKAQSVGASLVTGASKDVMATPVITLTGNSVTITCATTGATIYYTLDGSTPTSSSTQYSAAFTLDSSCTIKAIAIKGGKSSGVAEESYVKPITYLTQWKIVGNSQVHTDPFLTSWKVSGNSVVDNNTILSCGDYSDVDGKYHVKISNGVDIYDIALDEPLRKVNDVADTIEFPSDTEGKALVTRPIVYIADISTLTWNYSSSTKRFYFMLNNNVRPVDDNSLPLLLCTGYESRTNSQTKGGTKGISMQPINGVTGVYDPDYTLSESNKDAFIAHVNGMSILYVKTSPTTELVDVSPFPVSPTNTYTSANETPYSAFAHTENKEIWSCGEYNPIDGKYHILVQPQGGSVADIALNKPLRMANDVVDSIEFPSNTEGKALVTRNLGSILMGDRNFSVRNTKYADYKRFMFFTGVKPVSGNNVVANALCSGYNMITNNQTYNINDDGKGTAGIGIDTGGNCYVFDPNYNTASDANAIKTANANTEFIYELATPTTELVDAPQIEEADSYTCEISQGAKAVSWSSFETE